MTEFTQSEFVDLMVPKISGMNDMKGCNYSAKEIAEAIFRVAAKKRLNEKDRDKVHRIQFDELGSSQIRHIIGFFVMDVDKAGFIKKNDLKEIINRVQPEEFFKQNSITLNEYTAWLFEKLDSNEDGLLSMDEHISFSVDSDQELTEEILNELKNSAINSRSDKCSII